MLTDRLGDTAAWIMTALDQLQRQLELVPVPVLACGLLLPVVLALWSRNALAFLAVAFLELSAVLAFGAEPTRRMMALIGLGAILAALALSLDALRSRRWRADTARLADEVAQMRTQVIVFLEALDQRSQLADSHARDAADLMARARLARDTGTIGPDVVHEPSPYPAQ